MAQDGTAGKVSIFRTLLSRLLAGASVSFMIGSADNFRPFRLALLPRGFLLLLVGGVCLLAALAIRQRTSTPTPQTDAHAGLIGERVHYISLGIGLMLWILLIAINANPPLIPLAQVSVHVQFAMFVVGLVLLAAGLSGAGLPRMSQVLDRYRANRGEIWMVAGLTLLSLAFGVWQLETAVHTFIDELLTLKAVNQLALRGDMALLLPYSGSAFFPWIYPYMQLVPLAIFGHTLAALRIVSVVLGALIVPGLYVLARNMFDRQTAILAALFLATLPPHIHLNRLSLINVVDPFVGTWALAFLALGFKSSKRVHFILAGVFLGLTQYFYDGGKLLFPALAITWLMVALLFDHRSRRPVVIRGFILTSGVALLIAAPFHVTWLGWNLPFTARLEDVGSHQLDWGAILSLRDGGTALRDYLDQNLLPPLLHIIQRPDTSHLHYGGETPLILGYLLPVFFLGIFHTLWRWHSMAALPLLWLALVILGNSLLNPAQNTWSARYLVVLPALALLMAVGVRCTMKLLFEHRDDLSGVMKRITQVIGYAAWAFVVGLALLQPVYYFRDHLPSYNQLIRLDWLDYIDLLYRVRRLPAGSTVIAVTDRVVDQASDDDLRQFWDFDTRVNLLPASAFTTDYTVSLPAGSYAFFIDPTIADVDSLLRSRFPDVSEPQFSPYNVPVDNQFVLYVAAAE